MKLDPGTTALLTLDFQAGIFDTYRESEVIIPRAARAVEFARRNQVRIIHVGLGFSEGYPEIPDIESRFKRMKENSLFLRGSQSAEIHGSVFRPGDIVVYKQRVGAFSENHLELLLRTRGIQNLILFGIATSGITLSTLRRAYDLDFRCVVIKDACFDADPEVHRVLTEKVFPKQAAVVTVDEFTAEPAG